MKTIKILGISAVFLCCSALGIYFSNKLKGRAKSLYKICRALEMLKKEIEFSGLELEKILHESFRECDFIKFQNTTAQIINPCLNKDDISHLNEFFESVGTENKQAESDRINLYIGIFESAYEKAEKDAQEKCRIFTVSGICIGLAAAVLML